MNGCEGQRSPQGESNVSCWQVTQDGTSSPEEEAREGG